MSNNTVETKAEPTNGKLVLIIVIVLTIGIAFFIGCRNNKIKQDLISDVTAAMQRGCKRFNLTEEEISVSFSEDGEYEFYYVHISAVAPEMSEDLLLTCVLKLSEIHVEHKKYHWISNCVTLNGDNYDIEESEREQTLRKNYIDIYSRTTEIGQKKIDSLADRLPYEGMLEIYINDTVLGKPDEIELSHDFYAKKLSHKYKTYRWYNDQGELYVVVTTSGWDHKENKSVPWRVTRISIFD